MNTIKHVVLTVALLTCVSGARAGASAALVERGAYLARLGDCVACHTAPQGKPFAGGLPMQTPVGTIYSTNISPDPTTGIGVWTLSEFEHALRRGVSRDGHHLYPAMPYPSYAKVRDEDVAALYAYFMAGVPAVKQANRPSAIPFPLNMRWPLALWNAVFLDSAAYQPKPGQSVEWNRGAYLTQGLAHCGACHTPRGIAFQEKALDERGAAFLGGAELEGWFASNLSADYNAGLGRWSGAEVQAFLRSGANRHASAFGPMTEVVNNSTQFFSAADLQAMAVYLKSLPAYGGTGRAPYAAAAPVAASVALAALPAQGGARVYRQYCLQCHGVDGRGAAPYLAPLAGNPNLLEPHASSLVNVTLNGSAALVLGGVPAAYPMPAFAQVLNDREVADVVSFLRIAWRHGGPPVSAAEVAKIRKATRPASE